MPKSLRNRLIVSHILPLLIVIPVIGLALLYLLQTQILLDRLTTDLIEEANLISEAVSASGVVLQNQVEIQTIVTQFDPFVEAQLRVLDLQGQTLAGDGQSQAYTLSQPIIITETWVQISYNQQVGDDVLAVAAPVFDDNNELQAVVQLSQRLDNVAGRFTTLQNWTLGVLALALVVGILIGWRLAITIATPLQQATDAVSDIAQGESISTLLETGPKELRRLSRAVNDLVARLNSLETARRHLLANLVHEIGRPLGAMQAAIYALRTGADREEALRVELLSGIGEEIDLLKVLLDDLAHLHDQNIGMLELDFQPVALGEWLQTMLATWGEKAHAKGLNWQVNLAPLLPTITLDTTRISQVIGNLVMNAIKYTPRGGTVTVSAEQTAENLVVTVQDTGPGIDAAELATIFEPFYRGSHSGRFPQGMGLGLSIARDIAIAHGGTLQVASKPGQGTIFTLKLPL